MGGKNKSSGKAEEKMSVNSRLIESIEELNYRVTVGDVAGRLGLDLRVAEKELLKLAADSQGNLQVAETGDIVYVFPQNFRAILRNKYWRLRWEKWLKKAWDTIFYLIRISFGIILITSIIIMLLAIAVIIIGISSGGGRDNENRGNSERGEGGGMVFLPRIWIMPDFFWIFTGDYEERFYEKRREIESGGSSRLNFLESIYSFLFGDGNPNKDLEEKRWQYIAAVIRNNNGAIIAEQIAPYLDNIDISNETSGDYILPVLIRFNGYPQVSETGEIIYYFPELQVTASEREKTEIPPYLKENLWQFSMATSQQKMAALGLGGVNIILALMLGSLLTPEVVRQMGGFIAFVNSIYGILLTYAVGYLAIPLIRYLWLQRRNRRIIQRNQQREKQAYILQNSPQLQNLILYARNYGKQKILTAGDIVYTTERDILEQTIEKLDGNEIRENGC